jgi:hypothetical protein
MSEVPSAQRRGFALIAMSVLLCSSGQSWAGEKIKFSDPKGKSTSTPDTRQGEPQFAPSDVPGLRKLGGNPADTFVMPTRIDSPPLTKEQRKELEERREWMFKNRETLENHGKEPKKDDREDDKKGTPMERYLQSKESRNDPSKQSQKEGQSENAEQKQDEANRSPSLRDPLAARNSGESGREKSSKGGSSLGDGSQRAFNGSGRSLAAADLRGASERLNFDSSERKAEREANMDQFRRLFTPSPSQGGAGLATSSSSRDPGMAPGRGLDDLSSRASQPGGAAAATGLNLNRGRSGGLESSLPQPAGGLNSSPAFNPAPEPVRQPPKPAVLEIPKRKI